MITTHELCKSYGRTPVVRDVSIDCQPGTITGFLGPNGAGKSTTLRMITGLTRPDHGTATVAGHRYHELGNPTRVVGTLLDASAMHTGRTGRTTLRIAADLADVAASEVDHVLAQVGLAGKAADRRVGTYSLGMRQRLGIGQALIGQPRALILDEPANGLDPAGIAWMRGLLRGFADRGGTVLLSSHLLSEVQATVDRLAVISQGRVVAQGALNDLLTSTSLVVRATETPSLRRALDLAGIDHRPQADGSLLVDKHDDVNAERVAMLASQAGVLLIELRDGDKTELEHLFFTLTNSGDQPNENATPQTLEAVR